MDTEDKVVTSCIFTIFFILLLALLVSNWRWRANKKDLYKTERAFIEQGYVQKQAPDTYTTIWVIDPNTNKQ